MSQSDVMTNARLIERLDARVESQSKRIAQLEAAIQDMRPIIKNLEWVSSGNTPDERLNGGGYVNIRAKALLDIIDDVRDKPQTESSQDEAYNRAKHGEP